MDEILFEQNPNPMLIYNTDTLKILDVNKKACEKYGYSKETFLELTIKNIRPKEDIPALMSSLEYLKNTGENSSGIYRHQKKGGECFFIQITSQPLDQIYEHSRLVVVHDVTERIQAEQKTKQAYEELNHHITNSPLALVKWDNNFHIQDWSARAEEISGYSENEVVGKSPFGFQFFGDDEVAKVKRNIRELIEGELNRSQFETSILHKRGTQIHIKVYSSALRDEEGKLISVLTLIEDISEQKKSELKYRRLFENAKDGIFIMEGKYFVDCNPEVEKLFGYSKEEIIGKTPVDLSPEIQPDGQSSIDKGKKFLNEVQKGNPQTFIWEYLKSDGVSIIVEVSLNKLELADHTYIQAIVRDLTESKKAQKESKEKDVLFKNLFYKSPAALVMVDKYDCVHIINESFEKMFGYTEEEIRGKNLDELIVPENEIAKAPKMKNESHLKQDFQLEGIRLTKSGEKKHVIVAGMSVYIDKKPVAGLGMYIDISDRKEYEGRLEESLREKQVLLEEIHHRVKNNLAIISGILQLQEFECDDHKTKAVLSDSQMRIKSIALIHEMLYRAKSFSSILFGSYIHQLVDRIHETLGSEIRNIEIEVEVEDISLNINQAVPCALLLNELLTNSYKHAFVGKESGHIFISIRQRDNRICVEISDDGIGLPNNFDSTKDISLGMDLIDTLAKQIGANLEYSTSGGTTIRFGFDKEVKAGSSSYHLN